MGTDVVGVGGDSAWWVWVGVGGDGVWWVWVGIAGAACWQPPVCHLSLPPSARLWAASAEPLVSVGWQALCPQCLLGDPNLPQWLRPSHPCWVCLCGLRGGGCLAGGPAVGEALQVTSHLGSLPWASASGTVSRGSLCALLRRPHGTEHRPCEGLTWRAHAALSWAQPPGMCSHR